MLEVTKPNTNIKYSVDKDNGTVICEFKDLGFEISHMIISIMNYNSLGSTPYESFLFNIWESLSFKIIDAFDNKTIRGVAVCHPNDEFDMEYGMELSRARMLNKFYAVFSNAFNEVSKTLYNMSMVADDTAKFYSQRIDKFANDINSLVGEYEIIEE